MRAQIERAILWGFDVSHLDSHMGTLQLRPEFFDVYLDLAVEFGLPIRLSGASTERLVGFPFRRLAADEGVVFPDHFVVRRRASAAATPSSGSLFDLRPGVTEILRAPGRRHPRAAGGHARLGSPASTTTGSSRPTPRSASALDEAGVHRIGYRRLHELQRAARVGAA